MRRGGRVRMHPTPIYGFVKQATTGAMTMRLDSIAGRRVSAFNFAGTGMTPAQDADPLNYEVATRCALALQPQYR